MQKQSISLSIVLTADKIATDYLFKDGQYLSLDEAREVLIDRNELSDNERCYRFLLDKIAMNSSRFDATANIEKWGIIDGDYAAFCPQASMSFASRVVFRGNLSCHGQSGKN